MFVIVYDPVSFSRKNVITEIISMTWTKKFYETGSFEFHTKRREVEKYDIVYSSGKSGIVMEIVEDYPDGVTVYGYELKGIAEFRYVESPLTFTSQTVETIYKSLAEQFFMSGDRNIKGLEIVSDQCRGEIINFSASNKYLSEVFTEIAKQTHMGYEVTFDEQKMYFDVIPAKKNSNIVFSKADKNIENLTVTESAFNTYNVVYSNSEEGNVVSRGTALGIMRRESFTDKPDEMETYLANSTEIMTFTGSASKSATYGVDYNLGDEVKIIFSNYETWKVISEVTFSYDSNGYKVYPTFGTEKENPIKKLLKG